MVDRVKGGREVVIRFVIYLRLLDKLGFTHVDCRKYGQLVWQTTVASLSYWMIAPFLYNTMGVK